jgi:hypothetical protein
MATPAALPYGTALTGSNAVAWAQAILAGLGAPQTAANVNSLIDWFEMEGGGGTNNPLNVSVASVGGQGAINSSGVQNIATPADGVASTVAFLEDNNYSAIVSALKSGQGLIGSTSAAIAEELSAWSGGGYNAVAGTSDATNITPVASTSGGSSSASNPSGSTTYSTLGTTSIIDTVSGLAKDIAIALDYTLGIFGRGQGWRIVFTVLTVVTAYMAYKCLSAVGIVPDVNPPVVVPV